MEETKKYKAITTFYLEGKRVEAGEEIELGPKMAADLGTQVEEIVMPTPVPVEEEAKNNEESAA